MFPNHVLVAADGSSDSAHAGRVAAELARLSGGRITVLSVVLIPPSFLDVVDRQVVDDVLEATATGMSAGALAAAKEAGVPATVAARRATLSIAGTIAEAADELHCDLIVAGSRGAGRVGRALLGSVSGRLAATATCPVLVVPREG